jgi:hypothetical protein
MNSGSCATSACVASAGPAAKPTEASEPLSPTEATTLREAEAVIARGIKVWKEVGNALMRIRAGRLYRETHETFAEYCLERWGMGKSHAYRLTRASEIVEAHPEIDWQSERQVRAFLAAPREYAPYLSPTGDNRDTPHTLSATAKRHSWSARDAECWEDMRILAGLAEGKLTSITQCAWDRLAEDVQVEARQRLQLLLAQCWAGEIMPARALVGLYGLTPQRGPATPETATQRIDRTVNALLRMCERGEWQEVPHVCRESIIQKLAQFVEKMPEDWRAIFLKKLF